MSLGSPTNWKLIWVCVTWINEEYEEEQGNQIIGTIWFSIVDDNLSYKCTYTFMYRNLISFTIFMLHSEWMANFSEIKISFGAPWFFTGYFHFTNTMIMWCWSFKQGIGKQTKDISTLCTEKIWMKQFWWYWSNYLVQKTTWYPLSLFVLVRHDAVIR